MVKPWLDAWIVALVAIVVFFTGITWGLPSRSTDAYLLGNDDARNMVERLTDELPEIDASQGADVVVDHRNRREGVNTTLPDIARILCRYRLYSEQPDEVITFRSLAQMKPGTLDLDPRLYQYGGLWIYGVGAIIKVCSLTGLLSIRTRAFYISNPEYFARFYVAARAYSAAWGVVGAMSMLFVARRLTPSRFIAIAIALTFVVMPVVVDLAHEAKPHLAGASLMLLAALACARYLDRPNLRRAIFAGILCGTAAGMVLSGVFAMPMLLIALVIAWHKRTWEVRTTQVPIFAAISAIATFFLFNPYVLIHLLHDPAVLRSNLGNTLAMYHASSSQQGALDGVRWMLAGTSPGPWLAALISGVMLLRKRAASAEASLLRLIAVPAVLATVQFFITASGKPGEFGRFALLPAIGLLCLITAALARLPVRGARACSILMLLITATYGYFYDAGFVRDCRPAPTPSRAAISIQLQKRVLQRSDTAAWHYLAIRDDPAPYNLPPVNLFQWIITLTHGGETGAEIAIEPDESSSVVDPRFTPISWANKRFRVIQH